MSYWTGYSLEVTEMRGRGVGVGVLEMHISTPASSHTTYAQCLQVNYSSTFFPWSPHFWIISGHVPGLAVTCFRSSNFVSFFEPEDMGYSAWFEASICFQLLPKLSVLFGLLRSLQMTYSIPRSPEAELLEVYWNLMYLSRLFFLFGRSGSYS